MQIFGQNTGFMADAYQIGPMMIGFILIMSLATALNGWAMWRAARLNKVWWFVALLIINSLGILPIIFLLMTNDQYQKFLSESNKPKL